MFDTLNHLSSAEELLSTFQAVYSALLPGGYFMFDLNNERCYATLWTQDELIRHKDFTLLLENTFDAASGSARSLVTLTPRAGLIILAAYTRRDLDDEADILTAPTSNSTIEK